MAYPITKEALDLFTKPYRQVLDITFRGTNEDLTLTEKDVLQGGMSVNRYCVSGSKIELGSVVAAELTLQLDNSDGRFDDVVFEGAELYVRVGTKKWDARRWENAGYHYIPFGYFTIDEAPRKLEKITLTALDRMVMFDKTVDTSRLTFPMTIGTLLRNICDICNVTLGTAVEELPNWEYEVTSAPTEDNLTYRQILSWIAEITGTCGFIDWEGKLVLKWYENTDTVLTPSNRHNSDLKENEIVITGVQITDGEDVYLVGEEGYVLNIEANSLLQSDFQSVAEVLYSKLQNFAYKPFSATTKPMPHIYPLDIISFEDKNGVSHNTIVTNYTFSLNKGTVLEGKGETATKSGYAAINPLTKRESTIIKQIQKTNNETLNDNIQSLLAFNELISNAMGIYTTVITDDTGAKKYYMHDAPSLEESNTIYTVTANGFAYTNDGWKDGEPVWEYGFDKDGNAIYKMVCAYGLKVSDPNGAYSTTIFPDTFEIAKNDRQLVYFDQDGDLALSGYLTQPGAKIKALVGNNVYNYPGLFIYKETEVFKKESDGTYKPYAEIWANSNGQTVFSGINQIRLSVGKMDDTANTVLVCKPDGGTLYGAWDFGQDQFFNRLIGSNTGFVLQSGDTRYGSFYLSNGKPCFNSDQGEDMVFYVANKKTMEVKEQDVVITGTFAVVNTSLYYRLKVTNDGGRLFGSWQFDNLYVGDDSVNKKLHFFVDGDNPVIKSEQGKDILVYVGSGNATMEIKRHDVGIRGTFYVVNTDGYYRLQTTHGGGTLSGTWYGTASEAIRSDRNKKHDIGDLSEKYSALFDNLKPIRYKYNDGTSDRYHTGFIAQDVEQALANSELDTSEFAGFVKTEDNEYYLRYEEFIALNTSEIQSLKKENVALKERVSALEDKLAQVLEKLNIEEV